MNGSWHRGTIVKRVESGINVWRCAVRSAALASIALAVLGTSAVAWADDLTAGQWYASFLALSSANRVSTGQGVTVAVIDGGVDASHPDLKGQVVPGADFSGGGQVSAGDGRTDRDGHGTQMAGLIAGAGKVRGVAPDAKIMPINVSFGSGTFSADRVGEGIRWATDHGAEVISISLGGAEDILLKQAVLYALNRGAIIVAAAGSAQRDLSVIFPAAYPGVLAACGVDSKGNHSRSSVLGPELGLCAPSDNLSSTFPGGRYAKATGTSGAAALLAGAAALVRSAYPNLTATEVIHRLIATATDKGAPGRDNTYGYGVVNIVNSLRAEVPNGSQIPSAHASESRSSVPEAGHDVPKHGLRPVVLVSLLLVMAGAGVGAGLLLLLLLRRSSRSLD